MENVQKSFRIISSKAQLGNYSAQEVVFFFAATSGSIWLLAKLLRALTSYVFPNVLPGEPNTALLASPRPATASKATAEDLESVREYDYVIVGTGTAGCVLANRLSKDASNTVLAIESGYSDLKQLFSRIPLGFGRLFGTLADYDLRTSKQSQCKDRSMYWPRGKMIGGCSSINAMIFNKGAPDDYDEWARLGNKGWAFKDVEPLMKKAETFTPSKDPDLKISDEELAQHGRDGPWKISYSWITSMAKCFTEACDAVGIQKVGDVNSRKGINGATPMQTFIDEKGQRSSTAVAYLTADVVKRPNLSIASGQTVTRIIFDTTGKKPRAVGVEMAAGRKSPVRYLVKAKKEVIVCAGAVHTPQILKLSGVGPAKELARHSISVVKDLVGVGANLADHIYGSLVFKCTKGTSLQYLFHPVKSLPDLIQWLRHGTGTMTSNAADSAAFLRTADREDAPASLRNNDLSSGPTSADLEVLFGSIAYLDHGRTVAPLNEDYCTIGPIMLRPESRGTINLASSDPFTPPVIDPNYLSSQHDVDMMLYGMKLTRRIVKTAPLAKHFRGWYWPSNLGPIDDMSDEKLVEHVRATAETIYHPMCSAKMGNDATSVVDAQLKVHGIDALRIADASIFPTPTACHPCAPVVMVGEKAAELILNA